MKWYWGAYGWPGIDPAAGAPWDTTSVILDDAAVTEELRQLRGDPDAIIEDLGDIKVVRFTDEPDYFDIYARIE